MTMAPPYPSAYSMCSSAECQERQSSGEISIFECHWPPPASAAVTTAAANATTSRSKPPQSSLALAAASKIPLAGNSKLQQQQQQQQHRRMVDPHFAMTKYRRSAAGVEHKTTPRALEQLDCCLSQLEYILCHQQRYMQQPVSPTTTTDFQEHKEPPFPRQTLTGTVSFVEDRIRAIQVDLVVSQRSSANLQYRIVKCHILILYLLSNVKSYESNFGHQALSAALTNYWNNGDNFDDNHEHDDEILCFMALHQLCQYCQRYNYNYNRNETNKESLSLILEYYRRSIHARQQQRRRLCHFPKFQWALYLVELALMGRPRSLLRQLVECNPHQLRNTTDDNNNKRNDSSFAILCRCTMAPAVDALRLHALDQYNKTFMKGEKVTCDELARLLYFSTAADARDFCVTVAGLTRQEGSDNVIVFKAGPLQQPSSEKSSLKVKCRQDAFCFEDLSCWNMSSSSLTNENHVGTAWDEPSDEKNSSKSKVILTGATVDAEGVLVPPPSLLYQILRVQSPKIS